MARYCASPPSTSIAPDDRPERPLEADFAPASTTQQKIDTPAQQIDAARAAIGQAIEIEAEAHGLGNAVPDAEGGFEIAEFRALADLARELRDVVDGTRIGI